MEGRDKEQFDAIVVDMEDGPERVLAQALHSFDEAHTSYLEAIVLRARDASNPLHQELIRSVGSRLVEDFIGCLGVIAEIEPTASERITSVGWFLTYEQNKRADFINAHRSNTGMELPKIDEIDGRNMVDQVARRTDVRAALYRRWRTAFTADISEFIYRYKG